MKTNVEIQYCTSWGYTPKAVRLASIFLENLKSQIGEMKIIPSSGGVFEVRVDDELVYSKIETGRFPTDEEIKEMVEDA